jgi:hypothetical protein
MFAIIKEFIVKYLASMTEDELKSVLTDFAMLPQFAPFVSIVQDVVAAVDAAKSVVEPAVVSENDQSATPPATE